MKTALIIFATIFFSCGNGNSEKSVSTDSSVNESSNGVVHHIADTPESKKIPSMISPDNIRMNIFKNENGKGYGYDILRGGKPYIHQPNIPAVPGNNGFASEDEARRVATLAIHKIQNNIMPPTIEVKELDSLEIAH